MRLVTRGDVDGIMCAVLLKAAGLIDNVVQAHPKDVQDGVFAITPDDVVCNLPYVEGCAMWFDHHSSEEAPGRQPAQFKGRYGLAPSAARLVYDYFLGDHPELQRFQPLLEVVDRFDSANLTLDDVLRPSPEMLLVFLVDPRTGLGFEHNYRISNKQLTDMMPGLLLRHSAKEILEMPDVKERVERYKALDAEARRVYGGQSRIEGNMLITDLRSVANIPPANRFLVYTLPGAGATNISVRLAAVKGGEKVSIQVGHNIFNRTSKTDVGALMARYGGGGHRGAGTCQVASTEADRTVREILGAVRET
ncbi:MAG: exopolyphosphatase [Acidobacteriota bacterium]